MFTSPPRAACCLFWSQRLGYDCGGTPVLVRMGYVPESGHPILSGLPFTRRGQQRRRRPRPHSPTRVFLSLFIKTECDSRMCGGGSVETMSSGDRIHVFSRWLEVFEYPVTHFSGQTHVVRPRIFRFSVVANLTVGHTAPTGGTRFTTCTWSAVLSA